MNFYNKKMKHSIATITHMVKQRSASHINVFWSVGVADGFI